MAAFILMLKTFWDSKVLTKVDLSHLVLGVVRLKNRDRFFLRLNDWKMNIDSERKESKIILFLPSLRLTFPELIK